MTPEDKMLERFTREKQTRAKGGAMFNLDEEADPFPLNLFSLDVVLSPSLANIHKEHIRPTRKLQALS